MHQTRAEAEQRNGRHDASEVKRAASGQWGNIIRSATGIDIAERVGKHGPCPSCAGQDRFRPFDDFEASGGVICNQCFNKNNADGFSTIQWLTGCSFPESVRLTADALGLNGTSKPQPKAKQRGKFVIVYDYHDERRELLFQVVRYDQPKGFSQRKPLPGGKWDYKLNGVRRVLYRLPELLASDPDEIVFLCEGEKDCDRVRTYGLIATTVPGGAGKWRKEYAEFLCGRNVCIPPDNDEAGREGIQKIGNGLMGVAKSVKVLYLPGLLLKGDVSDWFDNGGTAEELKRLAKDAPDFVPAEKSSTASTSEDDSQKITIRNFELVEAENEEGEQTWKAIPLPMKRLLAGVRQVTSDFPRKVGTALFVDDEQHGISWLNQPCDLFGWLHSSIGAVEWKPGAGMVKQSEAFSEFRRTATNYVSVEDMPHEPPIDGHYYTCGKVQPGDGSKLRELLARFNPATEIDRDLLLASFVTPAWGGPAGARPAFIITSDDGRGAGKSAAAKANSCLWGGELSFSSHDDIAKMRTRLLSPDALPRRVATLDNVKSPRFSWGNWEALLTSSIIGGHRMYVGEAIRPNTLTWLVTLNGASLSTDIAQRSVIIKLNRPKRSGTWEEDTFQFIEANRKALIADCIGFLRGEVFPLAKFTRWATWEKDILQRLPDPGEAQAVIIERQGTADAEADEAQLLEEAIGQQLEKLNYNASTDQVYLPSAVAADWFNVATNERQKTVAACRTIGQLIDEGRLPRLQRNNCKTWGRGFVWVGERADIHSAVNVDIQERLDYAKKGIYGDRQWGS